MKKSNEIMEDLLLFAGIIAMVLGVFLGVTMQSPLLAFGLGVAVPMVLWALLFWIIMN